MESTEYQSLNYRLRRIEKKINIILQHLEIEDEDGKTEDKEQKKIFSFER